MKNISIETRGSELNTTEGMRKIFEFTDGSTLTLDDIENRFGAHVRSECEELQLKQTYYFNYRADRLTRTM